MGAIIEGGEAAWVLNGKTPQRGALEDIDSRSASGVLDGVRGDGACVPAVWQRLRRLERELVDTRSMLSLLVNKNEELESMKEELESVNEELYTVNAECRAKLAELARLREEHENLLGALPIGVLLVDPDLVVRCFNAEAARALLLELEHVGRPLAEVACSPEHAHLVRDSREVLSGRGHKRCGVRGADGRPWACELRRMRRLSGQSAGGVVMILREH